MFLRFGARVYVGVCEGQPSSMISQHAIALGSDTMAHLVPSLQALRNSMQLQRDGWGGPRELR